MLVPAVRRLAAALPLLALIASFAASPVALAQDPWDEVELTTEKVGEGLHVIYGRGGNLLVSIGEDGTFLIDDQFAPLTDRILEVIRGLGGDGDVRFVVNTHFHGDHTGGNENLAKRGTTVVAHHNVRARMMTETPNEMTGSLREPAPGGNLPMLTFARDVTFHLNGDQVDVFHLRNAHTDGDAVIHFRNANVIHTGDIFFHGAYPFIDTGAGGRLSGVLAAVDLILERANDETILVPGHGLIGTPDQFRKYRDRLTTISGRIASLMDDGLTADEIVAAKPTAEWDETFGAHFMSPERFVRVMVRCVELDREEN